MKNVSVLSYVPYCRPQPTAGAKSDPSAFEMFYDASVLADMLFVFGLAFRKKVSVVPATASPR